MVAVRGVSVVLVAVVVWTGGGLLLVGQLERAHAARLGDAPASVAGAGAGLALVASLALRARRR